MIPSIGQLVLGTSHLGISGTREDAFALLDAFVDLGGSIFDTAAVYNDWVPGEVRRAEGIIGEWLRRSPRKEVFICTKGGHPSLGRMDDSRLDRASITTDVEDSLRRLGIDRLDLFYLHRDDPDLPVEPILGSLRRLVDEGKVAAVGLSNWKSHRVAAARAAGIVPIVSNQVLGNVLCRHLTPLADPTIVCLDEQVLIDAESTGTSLFLFSSQCGGYLAKRVNGLNDARSEYKNPACKNAADRVCEIAVRMDADPTNLAVAFLLAFSPNVFPIIGPRTVAQLRHSMAAMHSHPSPAQLTDLAKISGFGNWRPLPNDTPAVPPGEIDYSVARKHPARS